ncbi:unnamed protein product [Symbiodinium necroappetens]|uniref:Integrase catalytic domain-containing protein n=1 Tax=Symbiodinium necroappetens TaxID=1628268 RepID=A0A812YAL0_9DINO|nr:unnamed protein product [Symbiodinium necroappetens]
MKLARTRAATLGLPGIAPHELVASNAMTKKLESKQASSATRPNLLRLSPEFIVPSEAGLNTLVATLETEARRMGAEEDVRTSRSGTGTEDYEYTVAAQLKGKGKGRGKGKEEPQIGIEPQEENDLIRMKKIRMAAEAINGGNITVDDMLPDVWEWAEQQQEVLEWPPQVEEDLWKCYREGIYQKGDESSRREAKTVTDALRDVLLQLVSLAGGEQINFRIRSDQSKEFVSKIAHEDLKTFNHFRTFAVPYSHQSNGIIEQLLGSLKTSTASLLLSGQLDVRFWDEVMVHAAKLKRMRQLRLPIPKDLPIRGDFVLVRKPVENMPVFEDRTEREMTDEEEHETEEIFQQLMREAEQRRGLAEVVPNSVLTGERAAAERWISAVQKELASVENKEVLLPVRVGHEREDLQLEAGEKIPREAPLLDPPAIMKRLNLVPRGVKYLPLKGYISRKECDIKCGELGQLERKAELVFLGVQVSFNAQGDVIINQRAWILQELHRRQWLHLKGCTSLPQLELDDDEAKDEAYEQNKLECQRELGTLLWMSARSRPDIASTVGILASELTHRPKRVLQLLRHVRRYSRGTLDVCLTYKEGAAGHTGVHMFL